ncbi:MAG: hypothetical protein JWM89_3598 [Acidimicrobiales bacterium]|nr:hypothetical protein [Acidimicrobiales bacterium]
MKVLDATGQAAPRTKFLDADPHNVVLARRWLVDQLRSLAEIPDELLAEAGVIISELVTNVFTHTGSAATISVVSSVNSVHVSVHDEERGSLPVLRPVDPTRIGGNGIRILDAFSQAWGYTKIQGDGKLVWFTLAW